MNERTTCYTRRPLITSFLLACLLPFIYLKLHTFGFFRKNTQFKSQCLSVHRFIKRAIEPAMDFERFVYLFINFLIDQLLYWIIVYVLLAENPENACTYNIIR